jgi:hypothetical protein
MLTHKELFDFYQGKYYAFSNSYIVLYVCEHCLLLRKKTVQV